MSLASEIRNAAVNGDDLGLVLRKCLILAYQLRYEPMIAWVKSELNGYPAARDTPLPDYRKSSGNITVHITNDVWERKSYILPYVAMIAEFRPEMEQLRIYQGVDELADLRTMPPENLAVPLHSNFFRMIQIALVDEGISLISAAIPMPPGHIAGILGAIRNRIIEFTLQMEDEFPNLEWDSLQPSPQVQAAAAIHYQTTIVGNVDTLSVGQTGDIIREITGQVQPGNWQSLDSFLREMGIADNDIGELNRLLDHAETSEADIGEEAKTWIQRASSKFSEVGGKTMVNISTSLLTQAIAAYGADVVHAMPL